MLRHTLFAFAALALAGTATAVPIGGGTTPIYVGSASFLNNGSIGVQSSTYSGCSTQLQQGINYRVQNWGWVLTSVQPCHTSPWKGPPYLNAVSDGPAISDAQLRSVLKADAELRARYNIEAYEAEQAKLWNQPADGGGGFQ